MKRNTHEMLARLERAGISPDDALALRRISMTLHRWHELECGDSNEYCSFGIERDDDTGIPYMVVHRNSGASARRTVPDRERGALRRLAAIMARYPGMRSYVQGDPRGAALYILRPGDVPEGADVNSYYSRGLAVYR